MAGALSQRPYRGGHAWVFLQHLLGLRRLGWNVLFLDQLEPGMGTDSRGGIAPLERSANLRYLREVMERYGLGDRYGLIDKATGAVHGVSRQEALAVTRRSAALINVMGYLDDEELLAAAPKRVFLDIDPGFGQMWRELGLADPFAGHEAHVTIAENLGRSDCRIPTCGLAWITTPQPVVLEQWPADEPPDGPLTSVCAWRGAYGPVEFDGTTYGLRVHEFRRFASLPRMTGASFELALDIDPAEERDLALLADGGWTLADPRVVASAPWTYQDYVRRSRAEFMVAKGMYVQSGSGWFSDRSICYLASGRPVIAQDTGLRDLYPSGEGLHLFSTLEEAAGAVENVLADPIRHSRTARDIAEERFDSDRVLGRLLGRLRIS